MAEHDVPLSAGELRQACHAYPPETVLAAVRDVCGGIEPGAEALVLCYLLTDWLTGESDDDPPPLTPELAARIWGQLTAAGRLLTADADR